MLGVLRNMINLEIKVRVSDIEEIKAKISLANITSSGFLIQQDTYFITGKRRLKLREEGGKSYFVFYRRPDFSSSKISKYYILNIPVPLSKIAKVFFNSMFGVKVVVYKVRQLFIYKNTRIHLDIVKDLGTFLELETVFNKIDKDRDLRLEHTMISDILEIKQYEKIKESYSDLKIADKKIKLAVKKEVKEDK